MKCIGVRKEILEDLVSSIHRERGLHHVSRSFRVGVFLIPSWKISLLQLVAIENPGDIMAIPCEPFHYKNRRRDVFYP